MFKSIEFFKGKSRGKGSGLLRSARNDVSSVGRSMIEMLGVLAIIGVLSVGGIAGYSKAMEKWKINRASEDFNYMIYGLIEHLDDLRRIKLTNGWIPLADYVSGLNLVPESWKKIEFPALASDQTLSGFQDTYNNYIFLLLHPNGNFVQIETRLGGQTTTDSGQISEGFSSEYCVNMFSNIAKPLSEVLISLIFKKKSASSEFKGTSYCSANDKCLRDLSISDISQLCNSCDKKNEYCEILLRL